jgi:Undecaprenyl-phosphate glucose phosphotransferase
MNSSAQKLRFLLSLGDLFHLNLSFFLSYHFKFDNFQLSDNYVFLLLIFNLSWIVIANVLSLYTIDRLFKLESVIYKIFVSISVHLLVITAFLFLIKGSVFSRQHLAYTFLFIVMLLPVWRVFSLFLLKEYRKLGYNSTNIIIVGENKTALELHNFFVNDDAKGYRLLSVFSNTSSNYKFSCETLNLDSLESFCVQNNVCEIYYTLSYNDDQLMSKLLLFCDRNMIRFRIVPDYSNFKSRKIGYEFYGNLPVITLREEPLQLGFNRFVKRFFDITFSFLVIVLIISWLYPILFILIKLDSKGPVIFKQLRSGIDNNNFHCLKFRTMEINSNSDSKQASQGDQRITKLGKLLRKTSLDEFPQFFNVLIGEMSIVGPRPHMLIHTKDFSDSIGNYMVRQLVKPGITGAAQANGFRGEILQFDDIKKRVEYDVWYIENWSLLLDIKLIALTVVNMIKGQEKAR